MDKEERRELVLDVLYRLGNWRKPGEIADELGIKPTAVGNILKHLSVQGVIMRKWYEYMEGRVHRNCWVYKRKSYRRKPRSKK